MDLTATRQAIADALNTVPGLNVRTRPMTTAKTNDGWVVVSRVAPAGFTTVLVTFLAVVVLGPDATAAEARLDELAVPILDAILTELHAADVTLEPVALPVGLNAASMSALTVTLTLEV